MIRPRPLLITAIATCLVIGAGIFYTVATADNVHVNVTSTFPLIATRRPRYLPLQYLHRLQANLRPADLELAAYSYDGRPGGYASGTPGLPTYGTSASDFPDDTAGDVLPGGHHSYASFQLRPNTVYYLLARNTYRDVSWLTPMMLLSVV